MDDVCLTGFSKMNFGFVGVWEMGLGMCICHFFGVESDGKWVYLLFLARAAGMG